MLILGSLGGFSSGQVMAGIALMQFGLSLYPLLWKLPEAGENHLKRLKIVFSTYGKATETETAKETQAIIETEPPVNHGVTVHYIDVRQADCILIESNKHFMLVDAGNNDDADTIVSYLKEQGVKRLDYVIGTHPHEDPIGSLDTVINTYEIGTLIMAAIPQQQILF